MTRTVAVVPARGGSKGAPGKNTRLLAGVPLWLRAVEQARAAKVDEVIVTTDIEDILQAPAQDGTTIVRRPEALAQDDTPMAPVLMELLSDDAWAGTTILLLQPTSPLRKLSDIEAALELHAQGDFDLIQSVTAADRGVLKYGTMDGSRFVALRDPEHCFTNRQALPPVMRPNGAVYVFGRDRFLENNGFASERIGAIVMPEDRSHDIDTDADFSRAEAHLSGSSGMT